jgi:6-phosphogluconolactonase
MTAPLDLRLEVLADPDALAKRVADWLMDLALAKDGPFALCLSGGSTPKTLYALLAQPPYLDGFPWARTHLFWGDERFVPPTDPLSNYRMVKDALLDHAEIPAANIHPMPTEGMSPEQAAAAYGRELKAFYGADELDPSRPLFDVNLLGLGPDGHTASLFPGTAVLAEKTLWAAAVIGAKAEARITLTYPVLESSRYAAFLVAGKDKADILARLRAGDEALPAAHLHPNGALCVFSDRAAQANP